MSEVIYLLGQGGAVWKMTLPLQQAIQRQYDAGQLRRVNADGSPYEEPAPRKRPAPAPAPAPAPKAAPAGA